MKKSNQKFLAIALILAGVYFIMRKKDSVSPSKPVIPNLPKPPANAVAKRYIVTTSSSSLNVRKEPNTSSSVVSRLPKGSEFFGLPSLSDPNWIVVYTSSTKGASILGYVSSAFATLK